MDSMLTGVLVVAGVAAVALLLRAGSRGDETIGPASGVPPGDAAEPEEMPDPDADSGEPGDEVAAMTSDGWTLVPFGDGVRLWEPADQEAGPGEALTGDGALTSGGLPRRGGARQARPAVMLSAGDLIAARVVPGTPGEAPWCLEVLGRDREFSAWSFETEEAARTACGLLERLVVKVPVGPDGEPQPVTDAEIEEARHIAEETLRELAAEPGPEPPEEPR
jgi:hypothetical protein